MVLAFEGKHMGKVDLLRVRVVKAHRCGVTKKDF